MGRWLSPAIGNRRSGAPQMTMNIAPYRRPSRNVVLHKHQSADQSSHACRMLFLTWSWRQSGVLPPVPYIRCLSEVLKCTVVNFSTGQRSSGLYMPQQCLLLEVGGTIKGTWIRRKKNWWKMKTCRALITWTILCVSEHLGSYSFFEKTLMCPRMWGRGPLPVQIIQKAQRSSAST